MNAIAEKHAWLPVCSLDDILPNTGVCALVEGRHIAIFRLKRSGSDAGPPVFALDNIDPVSGVSVLSRGLLGSLGERLVVASPIYKQHFDLHTGECLESPEHSVRAYPVRLENGNIWITI